MAQYPEYNQLFFKYRHSFILDVVQGNVKSVSLFCMVMGGAKGKPEMFKKSCKTVDEYSTVYPFSLSNMQDLLSLELMKNGGKDDTCF